jgi:hypothetical protein
LAGHVWRHGHISVKYAARGAGRKVRRGYGG